MITMMQYSVGYRYAINNPRTNRVRSANKINKIYNASNKEKANNKSILNRTNNKEVIGFMKEVASNVNTFKTSLAGLSSDIKYIQKFKTFDEQDEKIIERDLDDLVGSLNKIKDIINDNKERTNTKKMEEFDKNISRRYEENKKLFNELGIEYDNGKFLKKRAMNSDYFISNIDKYKEKIGDLNEATNDFLNVPMTEFVQFKNLNHYVNYDFKGKFSDTFKLIESGSLLNVII